MPKIKDKTTSPEPDVTATDTAPVTTEAAATAPVKEPELEAPAPVAPPQKPMIEPPVTALGPVPAYNGPICPICSSQSIGIAGGTRRCNQCGHVLDIL